MLSDNGTEFKTKQRNLDWSTSLYSTYHPASNGRMEGFYAFLKACIAKHVAPQLEWMF